MTYEIIKRNRFFPGTGHTNFDHENDFTAYHRPLLRLHHAVFHGWGIAAGLEVIGTVGSTGLVVQPGAAIDSTGEIIILANEGLGITGTYSNPDDPELLLLDERIVPIDLSHRLGADSNYVGKTCYLTIEAYEVLRENEGPQGKGRYEHIPWLRLQPFDEENTNITIGKVLVLAIVTIDETGNVAALQTTHPDAAHKRQPTGQAVADLRIQHPNIVDGTIQDNEAGALKAAAQGGLQMTVPNASDQILLTQLAQDEAGQPMQGNFAKLEIKADQSLLKGDLAVNGQSQFNGRVGINAANPDTPLHIISTTKDRGLRIDAKGKTTQVWLHVAAGNYGYLHLGGDTRLRGNGRDSTFSGRVGIGTTAPQQELHIVKESENADVRLQGGGSPHFLDVFSGGSNAGLWNYGNRPLDFATNGTHRMRIAANGDFLVYTKSAYKYGGSSWGVMSDARLKRNIEPLDGSLERLLRLRGVQFEWTEPEKHGDLEGTQLGFIAQEVEEVFPEWVVTDPDGYKVVATSGFKALTVEALREMMNEITTLKQEIAALKEAQTSEQ